MVLALFDAFLVLAHLSVVIRCRGLRFLRFLFLFLHLLLQLLSLPFLLALGQALLVGGQLAVGLRCPVELTAGVLLMGQ